MKIIHDMKNPLLGVKYRIEEISDLTINEYNKLKDYCNGIIEELNDAIEMTDQIRIGFKIKNDMKLEEDKVNVDINKFADGIKFSMMNLCSQTLNKLIIKINKDCIDNIDIQYTLLKRIINNFVSNALKHTYNGCVNVNIKIINLIDITNNYNNYNN